MLRTFCDYTALLLTLGASFFLLKGNLSLGVEDIAELSRTRFGYSEGVIENLATQQAASWVGFGLLIAAFLCQLRNALVRVKIGESGSPYYGGIVLAVIACAVISLGGWWGTGALASRTMNDAIQILKSSPDQGQTTWESQQERKQ